MRRLLVLPLLAVVALAAGCGGGISAILRGNLVAVSIRQKSALEAADATRRGQEDATPYALWQRAHDEAKTDSERRDLYRHAMVHAGYLVTKAGTPFRRCSICREKLG